MKNTIRLFVLLMVVLILMLGSFQVCSADFLGGKWATDITYYYSPSDIYASHFATGVSRWNNVSKRKFYLGSPTGSAVLAASGWYGYTGWAGLAYVGYTPIYSFGQVYLNTTACMYYPGFPPTHNDDSAKPQ